jgi:hypothetical protein
MSNRNLQFTPPKINNIFNISKILRGNNKKVEGLKAVELWKREIVELSIVESLNC